MEIALVPFNTFNNSHLAAIGIIVLITGLLVSLGKKKYLPVMIALTLITGELTESGIALARGDWRASWALPLQICDLSLYALVIALLWNNQVAWEIAYFWGIGGSLPAVLTPEIPFDFPYYIFITFFLHHGGVIAGAVYLASIQKYPLPFSSLKRIWIITHAYAGFILIFNAVMGTNYLFLCKKPSQPSVLDYFGPWPYYLIGLEAVFLVCIFVLYFLYHLRFPSDRNPSK